MRNREHHLGTGYEVWTDQQTWFWFVIDPRREGGTIGAAASEAEAVREAWSSIEELGGSIAIAGWDCAVKKFEGYRSCAGGAAV